MAFQQSSFKFALFFTLLFMIITVDVSGVREVARDVQMMKLRLVPPFANEGTCDRSCSTADDCSDGWICKWCRDKINVFDGSHYSTCSFIPSFSNNIYSYYY
ncbi:hypothetical protein HAX54_005560 [Datura stramonium]|uniref:Carboxypeptidase A inhibitor-like domain-containing protein n=1 Tax=Datura stramonium TaxID=4076 RepID=A0ABS8RUY5_DATST|nr:hypothetical protein [Datura stramonium]